MEINRFLKFSLSLFDPDKEKYIEFQF